MNPLEKMEAVIGGLRYSVEKSQVIGSDAYWDGNNWERSGRNTFLFRTPSGRYFAVHLSHWQKENDRIEPLEVDEAIKLWEELSQTPSQDTVAFEQAFPDQKIEDA